MVGPAFQRIWNTRDSSLRTQGRSCCSGEPVGCHRAACPPPQRCRSRFSTGSAASQKDVSALQTVIRRLGMSSPARRFRRTALHDRWQRQKHGQLRFGITLRRFLDTMHLFSILTTARDERELGAPVAGVRVLSDLYDTPGRRL
jgi:hypothetical protein